MPDEANKSCSNGSQHYEHSEVSSNCHRRVRCCAFYPPSLLLSLCSYPTALPTIPPLSSCHPNSLHPSSLLACYFYLPLLLFPPCLPSFPPTILSTVLLCSFCCLFSVIPVCLVSFLPSWLTFSFLTLNQSLNFLRCLCLPLHFSSNLYWPSSL